LRTSGTSTALTIYEAFPAPCFLSLEPLLGPLPHLDLADIHRAIVGGESGPGARPTEAEWVREIGNSGDDGALGCKRV